MKKTSDIKIVLLQVIAITSLLCGISSCYSNKKPEDTKVLADNKNEEKFDNTNREKDALFLVNAAEINLNEIQLGQLAQHKSKMVDVIELGVMLENSHTKSLKDLTALALKKKITIPTSLTDDAKESYKRLTTILESDFDKEYSNMMVKGHRDAITMLDKAAESKDADIRAWALDLLPNIQSHLDYAIICQEKYENKK